MSNMNEKTLSIVIPCYNEENSILDLVKKVLESPVPNKEIIVVDDCSKDGTRTVLERDVKPLVSKIVYHEVNQDRKSTRLNSSHRLESRMPSSA